ncbi:MAG: response regulator transcription factor [Polyangiaceae bacterium]
MPSALLIQSNGQLDEPLLDQLRLENYDVLQAASGKEGLAAVRAHKPDIVLVDLGLPDMPGTEVCRGIRAEPELAALPVMVLSERGDEIDRVVAFELGADDYVTRPFSTRELLLRIRALLRRSRGGSKNASTLRAGRLEVDLDAHRAKLDERELALTAIEFRLLATLCTHGQRVQSREALLDAVWGADSKASTRTVDAHVKRLREKLGPVRNYVETVRGAGYRFAALDRR